MAEIHQFPHKPSNGSNAARPWKAEETRRRAEIQALRSDLERPKGRKKQRSLIRQEDAKTLARRLGEKLFELKKQGHYKKILEKAGIDPKNRSRYALFGDKAHLSGHTLKLHPYVKLADAISTELGRDSDLHLYEMLDGINLEQPDHARDDDAERVIGLVKRMTTAVAKTTKLKALFDEWALLPGNLSACGKITPSRLPLLRERQHEIGFDHWSEIQPLPRLPLCRLLESSFRVRARFSEWQDNLNNLELAEFGNPIDIEVRLWREFGLCIAERTEAGDIGPVFSGQAHIQILLPNNEEAEPFIPWTLEYCYFTKGMLVKLDQKIALCKIENNETLFTNFLWKEPVGDHGNWYVEHYYFSTQPFDAWHLRNIMDRNEFNGPQSVSLLETDEPNFDKQSIFSAEAGRAFYAALLSGEMEEALIAEIGRLKALISEYRLEREAQLDEQEHEAEQRWAELATSVDDEGGAS
ncbi:hypothetical protein L2D00_14540 [Hyphomonadaceae bacterium BL14]|nr:hypothetical protein L2D00_14540 [Hyphomonadaceae bacterium BL14]